MLAAIDFFLPKCDRTSADERRRGRVLVAAGLIVCGVGTALGAEASMLGFSAAAAGPLLGATIGAGVLWASKRGAPIAWLTAAIGASTFAAITASAISVGGLGAPPLGWYALLPLLVLLTAGPRLGIAFAVAGAVAHVAFFIHGGTSAPVPAQARLIDGLLAIAFVIAMAVAFETFRRRAVDEMRAAREALSAANARLEQKSLALESHVQQLREAQEQLVQTNKLAAIGRLAAGVAHELNNPLAVILGFAQGMERRLEGGSGFTRPVKGIVREANRCSGLIQELLTFSRASERVRTATRLDDVLRGAADELRRRAAEQGVEVVENTANAGGVELAANAAQLRQVMLSLGSNALDAMQPGGRLTLTATVRGGEAVLEVEDTGTGISTEVQERMFEPFFTTKDVGQATGLGLALTYEIVRQHQGRIEVQSEPGRGTRMSVLLPR